MADFPTAAGVDRRRSPRCRTGRRRCPTGKARGVAFTLSFGSWVGEVVEIADDAGGIRIDKVWIAADVGTALDPGIIEAQLISARSSACRRRWARRSPCQDGEVQQSNFHDFDAMRIHQCPAFEVAILRELPRRWAASARSARRRPRPALANAIFALTGKRIRSLPLSHEVSFA